MDHTLPPAKDLREPTDTAELPMFLQHFMQLVDEHGAAIYQELGLTDEGHTWTRTVPEDGLPRATNEYFYSADPQGDVQRAAEQLQAA